MGPMRVNLLWPALLVLLSMNFLCAPAAAAASLGFQAPLAFKIASKLQRFGGMACVGPKLSMTLRRLEPENLGLPDEGAGGRGCGTGQLFAGLRQLASHIPEQTPCEVVREALEALSAGHWPLATQELIGSLRGRPLEVLLEGFNDFAVETERGRFKLEMPGGGRYAVVEAIVRRLGGDYEGPWIKLHWRLSLDPAVGYWLTDSIDVDDEVQWLRDVVRPDNSELSMHDKIYPK